jgi:SAM-dependent methyltransferase
MHPYLHPKAALKTSIFGHQLKLKTALRLPKKQTKFVLDFGLDQAVDRYARICRTLLANIPDPSRLQGAVASEIGCGDCFAAADMMLGLGAKHVHLVEFEPLKFSSVHRDALHKLIGHEGLPNRGDILANDEPPRLDPEKVSYHQGLLENLKLPEKVDLLYSFDVLEHVEDLDGFFAYCGEVVKPGGVMVHKFDLSGHGLFEDPMPPLDFQTFPRWLFDLIFPKYARAVGNFADEFIAVMERNGFTDFEIVPIRTAEPEYLDAVWPHLRKEARERTKEIVSLLDLVVVARRKDY